MSEKSNPNRHRRRRTRSPDTPEVAGDDNQLQNQTLGASVARSAEGGNMQGNRFTEFLREHKQSIIQGLVVVAIAVVVSIVVVMQFAPDKGVVTEYMATTDQALEAASAHITSLTQEVNDIQAMDLVGHDDLVPVINQAAAHEDDIAALGTRLGEAETDIQNHADQLATIHASPPECYLTGNLTAGNLTLYARASDAGNYTANVHLVYSRAFGFNGTYEEAQQYFYTGINWTTGTPYYQTVVSFNGTHWGLAETWWNIGTFGLTANNETAIPVLFGGLNYTADFAYAEIYRVVE